MKKKTLKALLLAGVLLVSTAVSALAVFADETYPWNVTFNAKGNMEDTFSAKTVNDKLSHMQPGDTVTFRVALKNSYAETTKWYMENKVIESLEDSAAAAKDAGGAYGYKLTYAGSDGKPKTLFESDTVGGTVYVDKDLQGLKEVPNTENVKGDNFFYLYDLDSGKGGNVTLEVSLDGESQDNAYQDTLAELELRFAVEIPTTTKVRTAKTVNKKITAVKTGDSNTPLLYIILAAAAGVVLLILAVAAIKSRRKEAEAALIEQGPDEKGGGA